ncbi:hypothetical protein BBJ28_00017596 [Nothophytophthora sp. Chile5]|nr:hypothetical protein BBJ28_00017596 [Nothophytophthora sp. Chile5]
MPPKSSSAKAKAKAKTPSGVDAPGADAPQAAASTPEDRVPIPRKAAKPVAAVSASADAHGAAAPETPVASPALRADEPSTLKAKTWGDDFLADLGMTVDLESSPEPNDTLQHGQAPAKDADLESEDKTSVPTQSGHSSAAASSPPPAQRKLTRTEWKAQRSGRATEPSAGAAKAARKRPASSSPLKETGTSRRTRHVPGNHGKLFYQSKDSHDESYEGSPSEEGEIAQTHLSEVVSNHLDEQQENYLNVRQSQFAEMRTPATGRPAVYPDGYYPPAPSSGADQWLATLYNPRPYSSLRLSTGVWECAFVKDNILFDDNLWVAKSVVLAFRPIPVKEFTKRRQKPEDCGGLKPVWTSPGRFPMACPT